MKKEPREYISPLLHPPLNRLFISRPRLEPLQGDKHENKKEGILLDKPKPPSISSSDIELLYNYAPKSKSNMTSKMEEMKKKFIEKKEQKLKLHEKKLQKRIKKYKVPSKLDTDPFKTIFLARLPYNITERTLRRELVPFGSISKLTLLAKRGMAFVEFEREKDFRRFVKENEEIRIEGRRVLVDVERGRTVENWLPRRLGGGLGGRRCHGRDARAVLSTTSSSSSSSKGSNNASISNFDLPRAVDPRVGRAQIEYNDI